MRIIQITPNLSYGDAVGNDILALYKLLCNLKIDTKIYAITIGARVPKGIAESFCKMPKPEKNDILVYHMCTSCEQIRDYLLQCDCRKIMIYHNLTPAHFFKPYNRDVVRAIQDGMKDLHRLKDTFEACIAVSEYNKQDLIREGYTCPIAVLPILVPFEDYEQEPDDNVLSRYQNDGWKNILFVGRIAPNKCQEDVIAAFTAYKKIYNPKSRLFIVGNYDGMEAYYERLQKYVEILGVEDVVFTGHISFKAILAYYRLADVFLCMSEHEGFCVPLLEAMKFEIPIIAYSSTAIPYTLDGAGVLVTEKEPDLNAAIIDEVIVNTKLRDNLLAGQKQRLAYFKYETVARLAEKIFNKLINHESIEAVESLNESREYNNYNNNMEQLMVRMKKKAESNKTEDVKSFRDIMVKTNEKPTMIAENIEFSFVSNYYNQIFFQKGIKAYIKRKLFGNLLNVLMAQEQYLNGMEVRLQKLEKRLAEREFAVLFREKPGLLIDVTQTTRSDLGTGIQRVVNNIFREIYQYKNERSIIPVRDYRGKLITGNRYAKRYLGEAEKTEHILTLQKEDKILLLDSSWEYAEDFSHVLEGAKRENISSFAVVYDLIPIQYPELVTSSVFAQIFRNWHNMILQKADSILCISRTTADVVAQYYEKMKFQRNSPLNLYYFHMGADVPGGTQEARSEIQNFVKPGKTFLMVGTLEPRKGHMVALQAFRKILKGTNNDCRLLIIGHNGWKNDEIRKQLALPEYKDKVLWIEDATDAELRWAYAHSDALIAASKDEGFGLPLVEAAHFGLPIICSDIPIFREVTQGHADYFNVMDADDLARCITAWLQTEKHPDSRNIRIYTWQESAQEILDIIDGKVEPYKVLE